MLDNYPAVARQASLWSQSGSLSIKQRMLATNLWELARILSDPHYGCAAEHYAAHVMYCHLCRCSWPRSPTAPVCPGPVDGTDSGRANRCDWPLRPHATPGR